MEQRRTYSAGQGRGRHGKEMGQGVVKGLGGERGRWGRDIAGVKARGRSEAGMLQS